MNIFPQGQSDRPPRAGATPDSRSRGRSDAPGAHPGEEKVWHTRDAILLCIGHNTGSENWCVPRRVWLPGSAASGTPSMSKRQRYTAYRKNNGGPFKRAALGAGAWRGNRHPVRSAEEKAVVRYAREHNLGKIVMGRPASRRWWRRDAFADRLAGRAPDLDQVIVALEEPPARALAQTPDNRPLKRNGVGRFRAVWSPWRFAPSPRLSLCSGLSPSTPPIW